MCFSFLTCAAGWRFDMYACPSYQYRPRWTTCIHIKPTASCASIGLSYFRPAACLCQFFTIHTSPCLIFLLWCHVPMLTLFCSVLLHVFVCLCVCDWRNTAVSEQEGSLELSKVLVNLLVDFGVMAVAVFAYNFETWVFYVSYYSGLWHDIVLV